MSDVILPAKIKLTSDLEEANYKKDAIILSVGTHGIREVLSNSKPYINPNQIIINVSKNWEWYFIKNFSNCEEIIPDSRYAILSGPSHTEEGGKNVPTAVVSASKDKFVAEYVQELFITPNFRVYTNPDVGWSWIRLFKM